MEGHRAGHLGLGKVEVLGLGMHRLQRGPLFEQHLGQVMGLGLGHVGVDHEQVLDADGRGGRIHALIDAGRDHRLRIDLAVGLAHGRQEPGRRQHVDLPIGGQSVIPGVAQAAGPEEGVDGAVTEGGPRLADAGQADA